MYKLMNNQYKEINPLLNEVTHSKAIVNAVLEGTHDGDIYVDSTLETRVALITTKVNYFFVIGETDCLPKDFYEFIVGTILAKSNEQEMILFTYTDQNRKVLNELFEGKNIITIERLLFSLNTKKFNSTEVTLPDEYEFRDFKDEMSSNHFGSELIERDHFGFSIYKDDERVSTCYAIFKGGSHVEIDIRTEEFYREKGFGKMVAKKFIQACLKNELKPDWACWPYNKGSINMAKSLGFEEATPALAYYYSGENG